MRRDGLVCHLQAEYIIKQMVRVESVHRGEVNSCLIAGGYSNKDQSSVADEFMFIQLVKLGFNRNYSRTLLSST